MADRFAWMRTARKPEVHVARSHSSFVELSKPGVKARGPLTLKPLIEHLRDTTTKKEIENNLGPGQRGIECFAGEVVAYVPLEKPLGERIIYIHGSFPKPEIHMVVPHELSGQKNVVLSALPGKYTIDEKEEKGRKVVTIEYSKVIVSPFITEIGCYVIYVKHDGSLEFVPTKPDDPDAVYITRAFEDPWIGSPLVEVEEDNEKKPRIRVNFLASSFLFHTILVREANPTSSVSP